MTSENVIKVVFVSGTARSGSTLTCRILGQVPGCFGAGEPRLFWNYYKDKTNQCGCGELLWDCPIWKPVIEDTLEKFSEQQVLETIQLHDQLRMGRRWLGERDQTRYNTYLGRIETLYRSLARHSQSRVIIDSSKSSSYALTLNQINGVEVYLVNLTRDPRGSAYSNLQPKSYLPTASIWESSWGFNRAYMAAAWNFGRLKGRCIHVRYEDLVTNPKDVVGHIMNFCGFESPDLSFIDGNSVDFLRNHAMAGNPDRFSPGKTMLKLDERWRDGLSPRQRWTVNFLTWPLRRKFHYV